MGNPVACLKKKKTTQKLWKGIILHEFGGLSMFQARFLRAFCEYPWDEENKIKVFWTGQDGCMAVGYKGSDSARER